MTVVWSPRALIDLDHIADFIELGSPDSANRVATKIASAVSGLALTPFIGRVGEIKDTRELVFHPWPYIAVYRVTEDTIRIIRVRHAAQAWP